MSKTFIVPSDPKQCDAIKKAVVEISDSLTRIDAERDLIKDIVTTLAEEYELPKGAIKKMANIYHKNAFDETVAAADELQELYEKILA
jgi:archaellum component FlaC